MLFRSPQIAVAPVVEAKPGDKIIAAFLAPHAEKSLNLLSEAGIAGFRTPESCADAIRAWRDWKAPLARPAQDTARVSEAKKLLTAAGTKQLNELDACRVFGALGVGAAQTAVINTPDDAVKDVIRFAVVNALKILDIEQRRLDDLSTRCARLPLAAEKVRVALRFIEGTAATLRAIQPQL